MTDVILDTLLDTAKLLPFLFLAYLLMEFLEHRAGGKTERLLTRSGKVGPLLGGLFGVVPQCGFSAAASELYASRLITAGALLAVYLSTSDEMLPIMISHGIFPYKLLLAKLAVGVLAGFAVDLIAKLFSKKRPAAETANVGDICEREHCQCGDHIALSALKHTLRIAFFLLLITFLLNTGIYLLGEDRLAAAVGDRPVLANLLAAVVGLIPNCASSVVLTELYLSGIVSVGALLSGLLVNAGVGLLVLFRNNRPVRDSFRVLAILFAVGFLAGLLIDLTPLAALLS